MWQAIVKYLGVELIKMLAVKITEWIKVRQDERRIVNNVKKKIKEVKAANKPENYRAALRNLNSK